MRGAARRGVCCVVALFVTTVLLGTLFGTAATLRALAAGFTTQRLAPAEPSQLHPAVQHPPNVPVPTVHIDFGQDGEHFDEGMSQLVGIVTGQIDIGAAAARPAQPAAAKQTGRARRRQLNTVALPPPAEEMPVKKTAPATADNTDSEPVVFQPLLAAQNQDTAPDSQTSVPKRRQRAPPVRMAGKRVPSERCQWLADTVDDSMRWFLHEERLSISDEQPFPRIWYAR
jgi:hypothetical protein